MYARLCLPGDSIEEDMNYQPTLADFENLRTCLALVIAGDLLPNAKVELAMELAEDLMEVQKVIITAERFWSRKKTWKSFADKYQFMQNDEPDDVWMNVRLSTLDRAGLEP